MGAIEKRARELLASEYELAGEDWAVWAIRNSPMEQLIFQIKGALLAIIAALTPPEGYVLVPVEPTESMQIAVEKANPWLIRYEAPEIWAAMLAARPEVP